MGDAKVRDQMGTYVYSSVHFYCTRRLEQEGIPPTSAGHLRHNVATLNKVFYGVFPSDHSSEMVFSGINVSYA